MMARNPEMRKIWKIVLKTWFFAIILSCSNQLFKIFDSMPVRIARINEKKANKIFIELFPVLPFWPSKKC